MKNRPLPFMAVVVALAVAAGAFLGARYGKPAAPVTVTPTVIPVAKAKIIPEILPEFSLHDMQGELRSIRSWPGKSLIINFWATWCAPCRKEIPLLIQTQNRIAAEGFQIVGVAVDFRDAVLEYNRQMNIDYPVLIGEQDGLNAVDAFGVDAVGFPFTVFTDAKGRIIALHLGELRAPLLEGIVAAVNKVNRGELTPAQARLEIARLS